MSVPAPHFLLYAEAAPAFAAASSAGSWSLPCAAGPAAASRWRFVLRLPSGETSLEAHDEEPDVSPERLELLAIVRGLEALEQPSRVTLMSASRGLRRGLSFGLSQWRENDWQWERYGRMTPVKNGDLWRRLDRLLEIHAVECGPAQLEQASDLAAPPPARSVVLPNSRSDRRLRIDNPLRRQMSEARNTKAETSSNSKNQTTARRLLTSLGEWNWPLGNSLRALCIEFGTFMSGLVASKTDCR